MSGDRHLRPDPDGRLPGSPAKMATVLVRAAPTYARTLSGQQLLQCLTNLLARQYGVVASVLLDVDDCALHPGVFLCPRIDVGTLLSALVAQGDAVGGGLTTTRTWDGTTPTSIVYVGTGLDPSTAEIPGITVVGYGWTALARTTGPGDRFEDELANPLGPHLAACIGAGFVFRSAFSRQRPIDREFNLWSSTGSGPELDAIELPAAYLVGLGAVGAAFGYELASARHLRGKLV